MTGESQLDFETKYLQGEPIPVSTDKTITQIHPTPTCRASSQDDSNHRPKSK